MAELGQRSVNVVKYSYLIGFFALLSGVFYPIITNSSFTNTISGILILLFSLLGGVLVYRGAIATKSVTALVVVGLSFIVISVVMIMTLATS